MFSDRLFLTQGLPWWFSDNPFANSGYSGLIPRSGRSPGEGNGNTLQYSCLGNPMEGGALGATVHGVTKSRTQLIDWTRTYISNTGKPCFMPFMPFYALLGFTDAAFFFFYELKVCGSSAWSTSIMPFFFLSCHFYTTICSVLFLCHILAVVQSLSCV